ncbi:LemA family protein [mine drainage metagenome]|uniref:LemA family protein n=1 Tax=mine drainage metagenome TaxID=410659 RepID=A0A1J5SDY9_9ZZZZ
MGQWVPYAIGGVVIVFLIALYNSLIQKKNQVQFAFSSIDAQLKKRFDLIPNLVAACAKYMGYEEKLLKELAETRANLLQTDPDESVAMDAKLSSQLRSVFALVENYPELKAIETFTLLQRSLNEVEEQLSAARRAYNAAITSYNNAVQTFPTSIMASVMGYREQALFEATVNEREPVKVWR